MHRERWEDAKRSAFLESTAPHCPDSHISVSIRGLAALLEEDGDDFGFGKYESGNASCEHVSMDNSSDDGGMEDDSMHCRQLEQPASSDGVNLPSSTCLPCAPALALPSTADELQFTMGLDGLISDIRASHPVNRLVGEVKGENMIRDSSRALQRLDCHCRCDKDCHCRMP